MSKFRKRKAYARESGNETDNLLSYFKKSCAYLIVFLIIASLLLIISSIILYNLSDPSKLFKVTGRAVLYFSSFLCAYMLSKRLDGKNLRYGIFLAFMIFALILILELLFMNNEGKTNWLYLVLIFPTVMVGSFLGMHRKATRKHRHRYK